MRARIPGSVVFLAAVALTALAPPAVETARAGSLLGVAGSQSTGVAVGVGLVLFSNTVHQYWDVADGIDSTLTYTAVVAVNTGFVACADDGSIWTSSVPTGTAFVRRAQPTTQPLRGLGVIGDRVIAVGDGGTILISQDIGYATWTPQGSATTADLYDVEGNGNTTVAVGAGGTILKGGGLGTGWQVVPVGESRDFYGVCRNANFQYMAVGQGGAMWRGQGDGVTWSNISGLTLEDLRGTVAIGSPPGLTAMIVGDAGTLLYTPGNFTNWDFVSSPVPDDLLAVAFTGSDLVAVGANTTTLWSQIGLDWRLTIVPVESTSWGGIKARFLPSARRAPPAR